MEAQGRGTLHLHIVLWLRGGMTADRMKDCLSTEEFRSKVKTFIATNIHADLPGIRGTDVLSIPREAHVAFSRPVDPRAPQYEHNRDEAEKKLA